jgi:hypothetical protein
MCGLFNFPKPQFSLLRNREKISSYLLGLSRGLNEMMYIRCLAQSLTKRKYSSNTIFAIANNDFVTLSLLFLLVAQLMVECSRPLVLSYALTRGGLKVLLRGYAPTAPCHI